MVFKKGQKIRLGKHHSVESKIKMSLVQKGRIPWNKNKRGIFHHTEEWKKNKSESMKGNKFGHHLSWCKGLTKNTNETIRKREERRIETIKNEGTFKGEKNPTWKSGKSFEVYPLEFKLIKEYIRQSDNLKCKLCGMEQNGRKLDIHHIDYDKKNNLSDNLISLCRSCNDKANFNRDWWMFYFVNKESM